VARERPRTRDGETAEDTERARQEGADSSEAEEAERALRSGGPVRTELSPRHKKDAPSDAATTQGATDSEQEEEDETEEEPEKGDPFWKDIVWAAYRSRKNRDQW